MSWKAFIIACVSAAAVSFPQNIIGCGGEMDPYDYYTSFFHPDLANVKAYKPFYYTGYNFLYDETEPVSTSDILSREWAAFCGPPVTDADAKTFVNKFSWKDLSSLYTAIDKKQPLRVSDTVKRNSMTDFFLREKDLETLGYIMYAKKVEPFVIDPGDWSQSQRDSLKMDKLIKNGFQLLAVAKKDIIQQKYVYQLLRLAHYSDRYADVIAWYDKYAAVIDRNPSVLKQLCLALKAGALFRSGQPKEAAYLFSKAFAGSEAKRISNYLGFTWSVDSKANRNDYLQLCGTDKEKAEMLALFALHTPTPDLDEMKEVYRLDPASEVLEVLAVREVNKMEETYFSINLKKENGGKAFYYSWEDSRNDSISQASGKLAGKYVSFFHDAAKNSKLANPALFETSAAYIAFMQKDYATARQYLSNAEKLNPSAKVKDQVLLTKLLVTINEKETIDPAFEAQLLPSIQWLEQKAKAEIPMKNGYWETSQWKIFYRNLMSEIIAKRYHRQGDLSKEALAIGAADWINKAGGPNEFTYRNGIEFLQNNMESKDVEHLYTLLNNKQASAFEQYLINHNSIRKSDVTDFAGTAYLREYNFEKAVSWFKKSTDRKVLHKDPFAELFYDREDQLPAEKKFSTTKLAFAEEMLRLEKQAMVSRPATQQYYKMALGMYNMTYYGHTWELVKYYRSGSDGYYIPANASAFEKEYYGCFKAKAYFTQAMDMARDNEMKAKCLFMIAKCSQKQIRQPQYSDYSGDNYWEKMEADTKAYMQKFMNNEYFPQLKKEYGNTEFYKDSYYRCSYLRDFVDRK